MKARFLKECRLRLKLLILPASLMLFSLIHYSIASETNELQENEYDNASVCDLILEHLGMAKVSVTENRGGRITRISHRTTFPFEPIFRYNNDNIHILADYIVVDDTRVKILHVINKIIEFKSEKHYVFHQLGIDPDIKSEEISAWCDKLHIIMKLNQERLLEVEIFTELNE